MSKENSDDLSSLPVGTNERPHDSRGTTLEEREHHHSHRHHHHEHKHHHHKHKKRDAHDASFSPGDEDDDKPLVVDDTAAIRPGAQNAPPRQDSNEMESRRPTKKYMAGTEIDKENSNSGRESKEGEEKEQEVVETDEGGANIENARTSGTIRREPVALSAIGGVTIRDPPSFVLPSTRRAGGDGPPNVMGMDEPSTSEPVAIAISDEEADEENTKPAAVATEVKPNRLGFSEHKRVWVCVGIILLILLSGAVAGIVVALVSKNNDKEPSPSPTTPTPTLPFVTTTPLPPTPSPTRFVPISYELQQVGSSLFDDTSLSESLPSGPRGEVYFGWAVDLSSDGQRLVATSPYYSSVYIYDLQGSRQQGNWVMSATISDPEGGFVDHIALSGDGKVLAVGMPGNDDVHNFGGKVQVYEEVSLGSWQKRGDPIFGQSVGHLIGGHFDSTWRYNDTNRTGDVALVTESFDSSSLALSSNGQVLAIGSSSSNSVQVFTYNDSDGQWELLKTFVGESNDDRFGTSVDLSADGRRIIVGAPNNIGMADPDFEVYNGHVRVFHRLDNDSWIQLGEDLDGNKGSECYGEQFGSTVSISEDGSIISIGANLRGCSEDVYGLGEHDGSVRVYSYDESIQDWRRIGNVINVFQFGLLGTDRDDINALVAGLGSERFPIVARLSGDGKRVALSVLAESLNDISGRGVVRLYELRGEVWEIIVDPIEGTAAFDHSGRSIALSYDGSRVAIGSPEHNNDNPDDGQVRVFGVHGSTGSSTTEPTTTPSPPPTIGSTQPAVPIFVVLNISSYSNSSETQWLLECGGSLVANETVIGSAFVTETVAVDNGSFCHLGFSSSYKIELYTIYYGDNDAFSPIIVNGTSPELDFIPFRVTPNAASVTVVIEPDLFISEIGWSLNCNGDMFASIAFGEMYGSITFEETIMGLEKESLCEFVITDAFGDGLCCGGETGFGSYKLYYGEDKTVPGALIAEGGEFGLEDRVEFVVAPGPTMAPTTSPSPTTTPSPTPSIFFVTILLHFDEFPSETGWSLYCDGNNLLASIPTGSYTYDMANTNVTETFLIPEGSECQLTITDVDGMCCQFGEGFYQVYLGESIQDGTLVVEGGEFENIDVVSFTVEDGQLVLD